MSSGTSASTVPPGIARTVRAEHVALARAAQGGVDGAVDVDRDAGALGRQLEALARRPHDDRPVERIEHLAAQLRARLLGGEAAHVDAADPHALGDQVVARRGRTHRRHPRRPGRASEQRRAMKGRRARMGRDGTRPCTRAGRRCNRPGAGRRAAGRRVRGRQRVRRGLAPRRAAGSDSSARGQLGQLLGRQAPEAEPVAAAHAGAPAQELLHLALVAVAPVPPGDVARAQVAARSASTVSREVARNA